VFLVLDASAAVRLIMRMDDALWLADRLDGAGPVPAGQRLPHRAPG
jgi:hypothetical protein